MNRSLLRAAIAAAFGLLLMAAAGPAFAHAQLLATDPAANVVLAAAPRTIELSFNEPVGLLAMSLVDPAGNSTDLRQQATSGATVITHLPTDLGTGTHVLSWRVASEDGHPVAGSLVFSIGKVTGATAMDGVDSTVAVPLWTTRLLVYAALFLGIGTAAFRIFGEVPDPVRRLAGGMVVIGLVAAVASLGVHGLDALGQPLPALASAEPWAAALGTSYGTTIVVLVVAFMLAGIGLLPTRGIAGTVLSAIAWIGGALALSLSGHASAAAPQWLTRPAVFLHAGGLIFWIGALVPLLLLLGDRSADATRALDRFSRLIPYAVAPVAASGIALAVIQLGAPGPHWLTGYGIILACKLGLLAGLFGLAAWNRIKLTAPTLAGEGRARHRLRLSIRAEIVLVLAILALVAGWRFTPPPRALAEVAAAPPIGMHVMDDRAMATLTIAPGRPGAARLAVVVTDMAGEPLPAQAVAVTLSQPSRGIEPFGHEASLRDGAWRIENGLTIPVSGTWEARIDIRLDRYTLVKLAGQFTIP